MRILLSWHIVLDFSVRPTGCAVGVVKLVPSANLTVRAMLAVLLLAIPAYTQTNPPSATDQKPSPPPTPPSQDNKQAGASAQGGIEILSDTMGVDFTPYLSKEVLPHIRQNWYNLIPEVARPPIMKKGKLAIEFAITKDGSVAGMRLVASSKDAAMDRAAWGGIMASNPFAPLPEEFRGQYLALRCYFYYNPDRTDFGRAAPSDPNALFRISPLGPLKITVGSAQQFSASSAGHQSNTVKWTLGGDACAKADCGSISTDGLYTAPSKPPDPPDVTVTAVQTTTPFKSASIQVTIVPAEPRN